MPSSPERMGAVVSGGNRVVAAFEAADTLPDAAATARLDGFRQGREEGLAVGRAVGTEQVTTAAGGLLDGLRTAVRRVEAANGAAEERVAELALALAVELAEAIVGGDLSLVETGEDVIVRALGLRRPGEHVRIRVHPESLTTSLPPRPEVELIADPELPVGAALAEIGEGVADISIDAAVQRVRSALS